MNLNKDLLLQELLKTHQDHSQKDCLHLHLFLKDVTEDCLMNSMDLKILCPDLYQEFMKTTQTARTLRIY